MAETEDRQAHFRSLPGMPRHNTLDMLSGSGRFGFDSNAVFKMPADVFEAIKGDEAKFNKCIANFLTWSPVNKIDNLNRDFFVLCHD